MEADFQFYPTPSALASKAHALFKTDVVRLLEPSAGEGHLLSPLLTRYQSRYYSLPPVDCIEIDMTKHARLRELKMDVVGLDFLKFRNGAQYSHVLMNPPFADGVKHVLHAWDILYDGEIVCILNAESLRNDFSKERQQLASLIEKHGSVEFITEAFAGPDAERKTDVEVALIYLRKKSNYAALIVEDILGKLDRDDTTAEDLSEQYEEKNEVAISATVIENAVRVFDAATVAIKEAVMANARANHYTAMLGETLERMNGDGGKKPLDDSLRGVQKELHERYKDLKNRSWANILRSSQVTSRLSSAAQKRVEKEFETIQLLDFSVSNIYGFLLGIIEQRGQITIDMACDCFDEISRYHDDNTVYAMGWKSNSKHRTCAMKIKMSRFILPRNKAMFSDRLDWDAEQRLRDFDKVFAMLDGKVAPEYGLADAFSREFDRLRQGERVSTSYFDVRYFRGIGTIHFFPKDKKLVDRLNRLVGKHRGWLPPEGVKVPEEFWLQYDQAEKFDKEVRAAVSKGSRWDSPFWQLSSRDPEDRERGSNAMNAAIRTVLESKGINVDAMLTAEPQQPAQATLLLEAA